MSSHTQAGSTAALQRAKRLQHYVTLPRRVALQRDAAPDARPPRARRLDRPSRARGRLRGCGASSSARAATSRRPPDVPAPAPASGPTSTPRCARHPPRGLRLAAARRRRRRAPARLPRRLPARSPSASGSALAQPAHAFASHAAWEVTRRRPGLLARRTRFVEIGPGDRDPRRRVRRAAAVPRPADGLGAGRALGRARRASAAGRSASSTPRRSATCGRSPPPTRATRRSRRPRRSWTAAPT